MLSYYGFTFSEFWPSHNSNVMVFDGLNSILSFSIQVSWKFVLWLFKPNQGIDPASIWIKLGLGLGFDRDSGLWNRDLKIWINPVSGSGIPWHRSTVTDILTIPCIKPRRKGFRVFQIIKKRKNMKLHKVLKTKYIGSYCRNSKRQAPNRTN